MISVKTLSLSDFQTADTPGVVFTFEDAGIAGAKHLAPAARKQLLELAKDEPFKGSLGETVSVQWGGKRYVLVGLGKKKELDGEALRRAAAAAFGYAKKRFVEIAVFAPSLPQALAEGLLLASYQFSEYKKSDEHKLKSAKLVFQGAAEKNALEKTLARAELFSEAVCFTRDLVNRAPSDKTPASLAEAAGGMAGPGITVKVVDVAEARELGMGSYLSVARGSSVEPAFVHLAYKPKGAKKKLGLVGKGITFDSGGLSLKVPSTHMETMKCDMAGAASVLAVFKVLARLKVKAEVHGFCAFTYNMPGPDATKPGDVVKAMNGKTIEILNTDAEGRLVLADALCYAQKQGVETLVDFATLTGAVVAALGSKVTGVMGNNRALMAQLSAAARRADEAVCELPLVEEYRDQIKSSIADIQNIGKVRGEAGSIIGGLFLEEFVDGKPWVHCDIAGTAWNDGPSSYCPVGGTGSFVRTILEHVSAL